MNVRWFILLALCACAPHVMSATEWPSQPPAAPCEVVETYTDAMGPFRMVSRYDADAHLVYAENRLTYDGRGFEYLKWKNGRVVRIDSYNETAFREGNCDVEGGCDEPASRTHERTGYRYDSAGRLIGVFTIKRSYAQRDGQWVETDEDDSELYYEYKNGKLVAKEGGEMGDVHFTWKDGHPVQRKFGRLVSRYEWNGDRLATYFWFDYVQTFAYDNQGRLVREVLESKSDSSPTTTDWTYDAAGRLTSETRTTRNESRPTTWTYDDHGRVLTAAQDGRVNRTFEYGAACPANLRVVRPPSAELRTDLGVCIRSPGYGYDNCFYSHAH
jgi:YD repeat-containing protein